MNPTKSNFSYSYIEFNFQTLKIYAPITFSLNSWEASLLDEENTMWPS